MPCKVINVRESYNHAKRQTMDTFKLFKVRKGSKGTSLKLVKKTSNFLNENVSLDKSKVQKTYI